MFTSSNKDSKMSAAKDGMINEGGPSVKNDGLTDRFNKEACDAVSAIKNDFEGVARRTGHQVRELADSAGHSLNDIGDVMTVKIRNNPVQSSFIALGIGILAGMLYRR